MRKKLFAYNTISSVIYQIIVIICGFVLPRAILGQFGSEVNGLVNSITQFLSIVSLMDMGVGAVVSSSLYQPLAEKNWSKVSEILSAASNFFNKLALGLMAYVVILCFLYPYINNSDFDYFYTATLIIIISANSFSQFYLGVVDQVLLSADQKAYITYISQAVSHVANTVLCVIFIKAGFGIHIVKLVTASVYLARPLIVRAYVNKNYPIKRRVKYEKDVLDQKWNAMAQHISECVLDFTDVMVLTAFSTLANVSVYSVYNLVVYNMKQFFLVATNGVLSLMGNLLACGENEKLHNFFDQMEFMIHTVVIAVFGCTYVLVVPFVSVYTDGITDAEYIQPLFAFFICLAHAMHCLRLPYFDLMKAAGHYRQTQSCFIIAVFVNIGISILLVVKYGLVGVAIGTLISMAYETVWLAIYCYKQLLQKKKSMLIKQCAVDGLIYSLIIVCTAWLKMQSYSYLSWLFMAINTVLIAFAVSLSVNLIFYRDKVKGMLSMLKSKL